MRSTDLYHIQYLLVSRIFFSKSVSVFDFDLVILKLDSALDFTGDNVKPICLPDASFEPKEIDSTLKGVISGWGDTVQGKTFYSY